MALTCRMSEYGAVSLKTVDRISKMIIVSAVSTWKKRTDANDE